MTRRPLITRRMLLRDMGKAGLALVVLGAAACSGEEEPVGDESTTASPTTSTGAESSTTTSSPTTTGAGSAGFEWHRVNLGFVSAYILYQSGVAVVVDTGDAGSAGSIEAGLTELALGWGDVAGVVVTHSHPDHQGSLEDVLAAAPDAPWYAGADDIPQITAPTPGVAVATGDNVEGLEIISTPGHTLGHVSVLDMAAGVLVAGDALIGEDGGVGGSIPRFTADMDLANQSVATLAGFDYEVALFGHGEPVLSGASTLVGDLADTLDQG